MNLQPNVSDQSDAVLTMGGIIEPSRSVVVSDPDTIDDRLDVGALADDAKVVPNLYVIGVLPLPSLRRVTGFRICRHPTSGHSHAFTSRVSS